ncbi:DUF4229 domain-containing protein [Actinotalea ferrariae]|uniref:DUF4229 domain-containing protein n=1 Tax=Actinotalea ferrariae TaxID=1386098 RepID=UPI0021AB8347|nr:DUF4229 domain-containing protein [Actinotalea ferrariae]
MIVYSLLRVGLLVIALVAGWAGGLGGWLLVVVAAVVAWALSYVVLAGPRDAAARWVADRAERRRTGPRFSAGVEEDAAAEDDEAGRTAPSDGRRADASGRPDERSATDGPAPVDEQAPRNPQGQIDRPSPSSTP